MDDSKFPIKYIIIIIIIIIIFGLGYVYRGQLFNLSGQKPAEQKSQSTNELDLQKQAAEIVKTKDLNRCQEINDETYKTVCVNNIALNLAKENLDISYCQKVDNKMIATQDCEWEVIAQKSLERKDVNVCKETQNQELERECEAYFWFRQALEKTDVALCGNISDEQAKNTCHDNYLLQTEFSKSPKLFDCAKFEDKQMIVDCKLYKENLADPSGICGDLKSPLFATFCSK